MLSFTEIIPNRATGYELINDAWKNTRRWQSESIFSDAAGGLLTNTLDLAKWDAALYSQRIITRSSLEAMWTPGPLDDGSAYPNGIGWFMASGERPPHRFFTTVGALGSAPRYHDTWTIGSQSLF